VREQIKSFVLKQLYFGEKDENGIALKYFYLRASAVLAVSTSEQLPEDGQVRPKHIEIVNRVELKTEVNE
jgi:hypothetical protein